MKRLLMAAAVVLTTTLGLGVATIRTKTADAAVQHGQASAARKHHVKKHHAKKHHAKKHHATGWSKAQKNAVGTAKSYLSFTAFSRQGLIEQLEYEGYSTALATFSAGHAARELVEPGGQVGEVLPELHVVQPLRAGRSVDLRGLYRLSGRVRRVAQRDLSCQLGAINLPCLRTAPGFLPTGKKPGPAGSWERALHAAGAAAMKDATTDDAGFLLGGAGSRTARRPRVPPEVSDGSPIPGSAVIPRRGAPPSRPPPGPRGSAPG